MRYVYNDDGRKAAGYKGDAGGCVARVFASGSGRNVESRLSGLAWAREAWAGRYPRQKCSPKWLYL